MDAAAAAVAAATAFSDSDFDEVSESWSPGPNGSSTRELHSFDRADSFAASSTDAAAAAATLVDVSVSVRGCPDVSARVDAAGTLGSLRRALCSAAGLAPDMVVVVRSDGTPVAGNDDDPLSAVSPDLLADGGCCPTVELRASDRALARAALLDAGVRAGDYAEKTQESLVCLSSSDDDGGGGCDKAAAAATLQLLWHAGHAAAAVVAACEAGCVEALELLARQGADLDVRVARLGGGFSEPLLHAAGGPETVRYLAGRGTDVDAADTMGNTALHRVVRCRAPNSLAHMQALRDCGASVSVENDEGLTPMHVAALCGACREMELLKAWGGDGRAASPKTGDTPFHLAAGRGRVAALRLLRLWGDAVSVENGERCTPLECAREQRRAEAVREIEEWETVSAAAELREYLTSPVESSATECSEVELLSLPVSP